MYDDWDIGNRFDRSLECDERPFTNSPFNFAVVKIPKKKRKATAPAKIFFDRVPGIL